MLERHLFAEVREAWDDTPVVMIVGARQVGKSTLAQSVLPPARHYTLDDLSTLAAAQRDPVGFIAGLPDGVLIDEIQRAPELLLPIKASVDRQRRPGRFLLTGSANVLTLPAVADSLAGRMSLHHLWPLSQGEMVGQREDFIHAAFSEQTLQGAPVPDLTERLLAGGYPDAFGRSEKRRAAWYDAYLTTLLERDIRDLSRVQQVAEFPRLLTLLAARSGNLLNGSEVARDAALNSVTFSRYLGLLQALYLVDTLPAWAGNISKRLIKAPKVLIPDTGLAAHLLGMSAERLQADRKMFGMLLENFVMAELKRQLGWSTVAAQLYHYRTAAGQEVDGVLEARDGRLVGIEVKASQTISQREFKGLEALQAEVGEKFHRGIVFYTGERPLSFGERLLALPVAVLWQNS